MSIATAIVNAQSKVADAYTACNNKGATMPAADSQNLSNLATTISSITTGGSGSTDEISFPAWVKDGDTHLWLDIRDSYQQEQQIRIRMIGTIDWGDGTAAQSVSVTTYTTFTHTYSAPGKYRIDLHPTSGTFYLGGASNSYCVMGSFSGRYNKIAALYQAEIGTNIITILSADAFYNCRGLIRLYVSNSIVEIKSSYAIGYCYSLKEVEFQNSGAVTVTTGAGSVFQYCYSLQDVHGFAPGVVTMSSWYRGCACLSEITIASCVTKIQSYAINNCPSLKVIHCLPTTPPTITDANAFAPPSACVIEVPSDSLADYQAANIWANYASQMVGV